MKETEERQEKQQLIVHVRKVSVNLLYEKQKKGIKIRCFCIIGARSDIKINLKVCNFFVCFEKPQT